MKASLLRCNFVHGRRTAKNRAEQSKSSFKPARYIGQSPTSGSRRTQTSKAIAQQPTMPPRLKPRVQAALPGRSAGASGPPARSVSEDVLEPAAGTEERTGEVVGSGPPARSEGVKRLTPVVDSPKTGMSGKETEEVVRAVLGICEHVSCRRRRPS